MGIYGMAAVGAVMCLLWLPVETTGRPMLGTMDELLELIQSRTPRRSVYSPHTRCPRRLSPFNSPCGLPVCVCVLVQLPPLVCRWATIRRRRRGSSSSVGRQSMTDKTRNGQSSCSSQQSSRRSRCLPRLCKANRQQRAQALVLVCRVWCTEGITYLYLETQCSIKHLR